MLNPDAEIIDILGIANLLIEKAQSDVKRAGELANLILILSAPTNGQRLSSPTLMIAGFGASD